MLIAVIVFPVPIPMASRNLAGVLLSMLCLTEYAARHCCDCSAIVQLSTLSLLGESDSKILSVCNGLFSSSESRSDIRGLKSI